MTATLRNFILEAATSQENRPQPKPLVLDSILMEIDNISDYFKQQQPDLVKLSPDDKDSIIDALKVGMYVTARDVLSDKEGVYVEKRDLVVLKGKLLIPLGPERGSPWGETRWSEVSGLTAQFRCRYTFYGQSDQEPARIHLTAAPLFEIAFKRPWEPGSPPVIQASYLPQSRGWPTTIDLTVTPNRIWNQIRDSDATWEYAWQQQMKNIVTTAVNSMYTAVREA